MAGDKGSGIATATAGTDDEAAATGTDNKTASFFFWQALSQLRSLASQLSSLRPELAL
jgi:hypothetical protein